MSERAAKHVRKFLGSGCGPSASNAPSARGGWVIVPASPASSSVRSSAARSRSRSTASIGCRSRSRSPMMWFYPP